MTNSVQQEKGAYYFTMPEGGAVITAEFRSGTPDKIKGQKGVTSTLITALVTCAFSVPTAVITPLLSIVTTSLSTFMTERMRSERT